MGAFILSVIVFVLTLLWSAFVLMSDAAGDITGLNGTTAGWWLLGGTLLSILIASSHWLHIGW